MTNSDVLEARIRELEGRIRELETENVASAILRNEIKVQTDRQGEEIRSLRYGVNGNLIQTVEAHQTDITDIREIVQGKAPRRDGGLQGELRDFKTEFVGIKKLLRYMAVLGTALFALEAGVHGGPDAWAVILRLIGSR